MGYGWGLIGNATANAPTDFLAELVAEQQAAQDRARKIEADQMALKDKAASIWEKTQRVGIDKTNAETQAGTLGLNRQKFEDELGGRTRDQKAVEQALSDPTLDETDKRVLRMTRAGAKVSRSDYAPKSPEKPILDDVVINGQHVMGKFNTETGQWEATNARAYETPKAPAGQMSKDDELRQTRMMRNEFNRETTAAREISRQLSIMRQSLSSAESNQANLPAASQGVLVTFQKILDPTSVVRESEYMRSETGQSLLGRMEALASRAAKGGVLSIDQLRQFVQVAEQVANAQMAYAERSKKQIEEMADYYGLPKQFITRELSVDDPAGAQDGRSIPASQRIVGKTTTTFTSGPNAGKVGVWTGKGWEVQ